MSNNEEVYQRFCAGKVPYLTRSEALNAIKRMNQVGSSSQGSSNGKKAYTCNYCPYWHVGTMRKGTKLRLRYARLERRAQEEEEQGL